MELAVSGRSYRHASSSLEQLLGYRVISHEAIRQRILEAEVSFKKEMKQECRLLFIEVDGLYIKHQREKKRGREEKIASVHEGWKRIGKRVSLVNKRHFVHKGEAPFWEEFEQFLFDNYQYDPTYHILIINGDGAGWITACRDYFSKRKVFFTLDRFHVARDIQSLFRNHPRYTAIRRRQRQYDGEGLLLELNSAVGTLDEPEKEECLEQLIKHLSQFPEALGDYREWLKAKGIDTTGMRPMGSAESTMSVFANRVKNGRAWCKSGIKAFLDVMIGLMDGLSVKTAYGLVGTEDKKKKKNKQKGSKDYLEKLKNSAGEAVRNNLAYLQHKSGTPIYHALNSLKGF